MAVVEDGRREARGRTAALVDGRDVRDVGREVDWCNRAVSWMEVTKCVSAKPRLADGYDDVGC